MSERDRRQLIHDVLSNPMMFPQSFKQWLPAYLAPEVTVTQSQVLNVAYQDYTPTVTGSVTNPSLGTGGAALARYTRIGNLVHMYGHVEFGTAPSAGSGYYAVSLPIEMGPVYVSSNLGGWHYDDASTGNNAFGAIRVDTTSTVKFTYPATWLGALTNVGAAAPWAPAIGDILHFNVVYEITSSP